VEVSFFDRAQTCLSQPSLAEEAVTRDAIEPFLTVRGYLVLRDHRTQTGTAIAQFLRVQTPEAGRCRCGFACAGVAPTNVRTREKSRPRNCERD
jgi:hypothetical protein